MSADDAQLNIGNSLHNGGKYREAVTEYQRVISDYAGTDSVPAAHYKLGQTYMALKQNDLARKQFETLMQALRSNEATLAKQALDRDQIAVGSVRSRQGSLNLESLSAGSTDPDLLNPDLQDLERNIVVREFRARLDHVLIRRCAGGARLLTATAPAHPSKQHDAIAADLGRVALVAVLVVPIRLPSLPST